MQGEKSRIPNDQRSARTRTALIAAGRDCFVERGYAATGTPEIVARAGMTRGALYHHFADKQALFAAVVEAEHAAVASEIATGSARAGPLDALRSGAVAYLRAMQAPGRTALLLMEAPAALGVEAATAADARHARAELRAGLEAAMTVGDLRPAPLDALADVLGSAFDGAALAIHRGRPFAQVESAVLALIDGLAGRGGAQP